MKKSTSKFDKALLAAATKPAHATKNKSREAAANSFLYKAKHSSVARPTKAKTKDNIDRLIEAENRFPDHHPDDMRKDGDSTRFFFKHTNVPELQEGLEGVIDTYTLHVLGRYSDEQKYPRMSDFMTAYPLGHEKPAFNETYYYRNANKMVEVENHNNNLPANATPKAMPEPVLTEFAQKHVDLQRKLYLCLRANYHRFMDNACKTTIDYRIKTFESDHNLEGEDRLDLNKRYTWTRMRNDMAALCCIATPTGFYFLPLYTTVREDNCTVHDWLISVLRLYSTLRTEDSDWGELAQADAVHRM